ncbi:acetyltransferase [Colletotrichum tofieldiae]|nr:acetyltransferase [Colletotrichum tofieldiae]GKT79972.1 acetyltransferase [Colletotrichum tofieldiae]GKT85472.1 acetyltransferase [Colletotrichum tofieldiae]
MQSQHHMGIRELNVSNWHSHNALTDTFNHAVPAIKTSAESFQRFGKPFGSFFRVLLCVESASKAPKVSTTVTAIGSSVIQTSPEVDVEHAHLV